MFDLILIASIFVIYLALMAFLWLGAAIDDIRYAKKEKRYRKQWLKDWHEYNRTHPKVSVDEYISQHQNKKPLAMPYKRHFSLGKVCFILAIICGLVELYVLHYGFKTFHHHTTSLGWFTFVLVVIFIVWYWAILEEKVLPSYTRIPPNNRASVSPLP